MTAFLVIGTASFDVSTVVEAESEEAACEAARKRQAPRAVAWRSNDAPSWDVDPFGNGGSLRELTAKVQP